ncbi:MAG: tetratricopeptide repeat protein [Gammaproteobacteria bacterium]|nr:tetratricopeptide repeat protein [Gammaproteobacteria bacterium]
MAISLAGCATGRQPAPVEELGAPAGTTLGTPSQGGVPSAMGVPPTGEAVTIPLGEPGLPATAAGAPPGSGVGPAPANPAVVALLNDANLAMQNGRNDRAAASLERALGIEPRNAWLWHRLASTRFQQGDLSQAAALAAKSNSFASPDRKLQAANWRIIADVHRRQGEVDAARSAEEKAAGLEIP